MIVLIRKTPGGSWQGRAIDAPEHIPPAVWHGSQKKVRESYLRYARGEEIKFVDFSEGWNVED